jgi:hypothetical protein
MNFSTSDLLLRHFRGRLIKETLGPSLVLAYFPTSIIAFPDNEGRNLRLKFRIQGFLSEPGTIYKIFIAV